MTMYAMIVAIQNKTQSYTKRVPRNDFIFFAIENYNRFHPHFDSFLTFFVHAYIVHHQQLSLVPLMFISHYRQQMSITLQCVQAITIHQQVATLSESSSSLLHILVHAPPSLANLWHRMPF